MTKFQIERQSSEWSSFSYATRKGQPRLVSLLYFIISLSFTWFLALQLPLSRATIMFLAITTTGTILVPLINMRHLIHYLVASMGFGGGVGYVFTSTFYLWNSMESLNYVMGITAFWLAISCILSPKFIVFEWVVLWTISSWMPIIWFVINLDT